ncbi:MAG: CvpA family protein [Acutalibacteraceae bacterium]|nr:CvpA family protein [Acutalibacteraceae bacterium]
MNPFSIAIDVVFVAIIVICIILGRKKGFIRMVLSLVALIASWIVANKFAPAASQWLNDNFIREKAIALLTEKLTAVIENGSREIIEAIPEYIINAAKLADISFESILTSAGEPSVAAENIFSACETTVVLPVLEFIMFIAIFIAVSIVLSVVVRLADKLFDLPVLKNLNKMLGAAIGAVKGVCYAGVLGVILNAASYITSDSKVAEAINGSYIQTFISFLIEKI